MEAMQAPDCPSGNFCLDAGVARSRIPQVSALRNWPVACCCHSMIEALATRPHQTIGKHNMASDAFDALRTARLQGKAPEGSSMSFSDFLDTVNPLQHIPVVAQIYRQVTGDTISPQARVAGGALYGGPIGLVASVIDAAVAAVSGADLGQHLIAGIFGDDKAAPTTVADATKSAPVHGPVPAPATKLALSVPAVTGPPAPPPASAPAKTFAAKPVPQLSSEAFNALIGSFADPKAAKAANPDLVAKAVAKTDMPAAPMAPATVAATAKSGDIIGAMQSGLDQLDALKRKEEMPAKTVAAGETGGV